jgi:hypothetical protein
VYLQWKTETETNNDHYEVERSFDAVNFETILSVNSKAPNGTSVNPLDYKATDNDLKHSVYYYRLKQVDKSGQFSYTGMASVRIYATEFTIYPNPNNGTFGIEIPGLKSNEQLNITVYNNLGEIVHRASQIIGNDQSNGSHVNIVPTKPLPAGIYLTSITFMGETRQLKLVVQ